MKPFKLPVAAVFLVGTLCGSCDPASRDDTPNEPTLSNSSSSSTSPSPREGDEHRLTVVIVVDQLPQTRWAKLRGRYSTDGFMRLVERGRTFSNAHYDHATTFTAVGHAAIVTGVLPADHGIVANSWRSRTSGEVVYSVTSRAYPDPGTLQYPTIGDRLSEQSSGKSSVWSVALKDRSAVLMGGQTGTAVWWDWKSGRMKIRQPAGAEPPAWIQPWLTPDDMSRLPSLAGRTWNLLQPVERYADHFPDKVDFPKSLPADEFRARRVVRATPYGDEIITDLAIEVLRNENPELLFVGFSALDYVGHQYGPDSLEYEDQLLQLDRSIASLLDEIEERVGLDHALIVLTSDHGTDSTTDYNAFVGRPTGRLLGEEFVPRLNAELREELDIQVDLIAGFYTPGVYLDRANLASSGVSYDDAVSRTAGLLSSIPEVEAVYRSTEEGPVPVDGRSRSYDELVRNAFHFDRSGDLILIPKAHVYLGRVEDGDLAMHGTPYAYDTEVPIVIAGRGFVRGLDASPVTPRQIAPTLAAALGLPADPRWLPALPSGEPAAK